MINNINDKIRKELKGKRIGAFDYGLKRIGFAVTDEFHITTSPRRIFDADSETLMDEISEEVIKERLGAIVIGIPYRHDGQTTDVIEEIKEFIAKVEEVTGLEVYPYDESFSSCRAMETMISIGKKKKQRRTKGSADKIAAAIILRDFLRELDG